MRRSWPLSMRCEVFDGLVWKKAAAADDDDATDKRLRRARVDGARRTIDSDTPSRNRTDKLADWMAPAASSIYTVTCNVEAHAWYRILGVAVTSRRGDCGRDGPSDGA